MTLTNATHETIGIPPAVRRILSRLILDLRESVEEDFRRQLAAVGVRETGIEPLAGRIVAPPDRRVREVAVAVIGRGVAGGERHAEAYGAFVRESGFTFVNRAVGLRCLEARGLLLVDGQSETVFTIDPARSASSLYWRVRNELPPQTSPREVWREALRRAGVAVSEQVRVLFDPESEFAALLPLQPTLQATVDALNRPDVPPATYAQDEVLGWVYQYYNTREKQAVYDRLGKGKKIERPDELAAATCLYTERYMVDYLLQNTLGALWVDAHPESELPNEWPYFVRGAARPRGEEGKGERGKGKGREGNDESVPSPASPSPFPFSLSPFPSPPRRLRDVTLLDPACGSGHFLVRAFDLLVGMYREEGIEPEAEIPHLILEHNLHGIDIDLRAVQIAALALYIKGCALAGPAFRPRRLNLVPADALLPGDAPPADYLARFTGDAETVALVTGIWRGLKNVREFGSLLHPERAVDAAVARRREEDAHRYPMLQRGDAEWEQWKRDLLGGLREEFERQAHADDLGQRLFGEDAAKGIGLVEALGRRYDVVVANPPYQGSGSLKAHFRQFLVDYYIDGRDDLYTAFIQRCREFCTSGGFVGMVTQQSWMFLRSFAALRRDMLERMTISTIAHLGPHAFEEISGEVVNIALFTVRAVAPAHGHRLTGFRLVGTKSVMEKDRLLRQASSGQSRATISNPRQAAFMPIPQTPFVYWLRPRFFELLQSERRLNSIADVREGLGTRDDERFLRFGWEVTDFGVVENRNPIKGRWYWCAKGGGYQRWAGTEWFVVNWGEDGQEIKEFVLTLPGTTHWSRYVRNRSYYFRPGLMYSRMSLGSLGARQIDRMIFVDTSPCIFPNQDNHHLLSTIAAICVSRPASYMLRILTQSLEFRPGYVRDLPLPDRIPDDMGEVGQRSIELKRRLTASDPLERSFRHLPIEIGLSTSFLGAIYSGEDNIQLVQATLHWLEGYNEKLASNFYRLDDEDLRAVVEEMGQPSGWFPFVAGYDQIPSMDYSSAMCAELQRENREHERFIPSVTQLARLKDRTKAVYCAGPGAAITDDPAEPSTETGHGQSEPALGALIPIPVQTFLEELAQRLKIHPISVYWLLKEMREQEGLVSPPELKRQIEDYASVTVLRLLGYRWPEQDAYEKEHGPILDPDLVDGDGIIPLVACEEHATADDLVRRRLERDFGEAGAETSVAEFRRWVGRDLGEWLRRDLFKRHVQQFKQRPIAWHFTSAERTFEAFVLYHQLNRATLQRLRTQYAGALVERLRGEHARARERGDAKRQSELAVQIQDVEDFRVRIEAIERGDTLKDRIRCRWKGEEATGRPGPYAPDIDDGVKVNIRPFQENGLLVVKEVIKKW